MITIGVLALQGDVREHRAMLRAIGAKSMEIRLPTDLANVQGLIIPGGESTTIGKLARTFGLIEPLQDFGRAHPVWGTCAGAILLSKDARRDQPLLGLMDIHVERNAFGRQVDSFITDVSVPALAEPERPFPAVFIRAPIFEDVGESVSQLASLPGKNGKNNIVAVQEQHLLATSFHPELTHDTRFHEYFASMVEEQV